MIYQIKKGQLKKQDLESYHYKDKDEWLFYMNRDTFLERAEELRLPRHIVNYCNSIDISFRSSMQVEESFLYGNLTILDVTDMNQNRGQIGLILSSNRLYIIEIIGQEGKIKKLLQKAMERYEQKITLAKLLFAFLDGCLAGGSEALEKMEKQMVSMEHELVENRIDSNLNKDIFYLKKRISVIKNYYGQMIDLGDSLKACETELLNGTNQRYLTLFLDKANRLSENTGDIKEGLVHLRETLDASLEYNLNRIMKLFTVVTTVFMPLTLIAGWYGMNFEYMPELHWQFGYGMVWLVSVLVVVVCFIFFKKMKFI